MNHEIIFNKTFDFSHPKVSSPNALYLLVAYQDERLTFVVEPLLYRSRSRDPMDMEEFRKKGFGDGAELLATIRRARGLLVGGLYIGGLMLVTTYASDLHVLEEKMRGVGRRLTEAEELTAPELVLVSCAESRSRVVLHNKSSLLATPMKSPRFEDFTGRVGRAHLFLRGCYSTAEALDLDERSPFLSALAETVREELLASVFVVDGRAMEVQRAGAVPPGEIVQLKGSEPVIERLLAVDGVGEEKAAAVISMTLFCYYALNNTLEDVVEHLCDDFDRSLLTRAERTGDNAALPKRLIAAQNGLYHGFYVSSDGDVSQAIQDVQQWLVGPQHVEIVDYEKINCFEWHSMKSGEAPSEAQPTKPEDFARTVPQLITVCLAVLLALLLKRVLIG